MESFSSEVRTYPICTFSWENLDFFGVRSNRRSSPNCLLKIRRRQVSSLESDQATNPSGFWFLQRFGVLILECFPELLGYSRLSWIALNPCESLWSNPCHHCDSLGFEPKKIDVFYDLDLQRAYQDRQNGKHWKILISWRFGRAFGRKFITHETRSKCVQTPKSTIMRQCRWSCSISSLIRLKIHLESIFAVDSVMQLKLPPSGFCRTKLAWGSTQPQAYVFESWTCRVSRRFKVSDFQHHLLARDLGYGVTIPPDRALWSFVSCRWKLWSAWHGRICYVPLQMAP